MLFGQFLKLFYSQVVILWGKHYHGGIRGFFVHDWCGGVVSGSIRYGVYPAVLHLPKVLCSVVG